MAKYELTAEGFSIRIKQLRLDNKLTQRQMAQILGINERTYQNFEAKRYLPSHKTMTALINHFGIEAYENLFDVLPDDE